MFLLKFWDLYRTLLGSSLRKWFDAYFIKRGNSRVFSSSGYGEVFGEVMQSLALLRSPVKVTPGKQGSAHRGLADPDRLPGAALLSETDRISMMQYAAFFPT